MNTIGTAVLHLTRAAVVHPQAATGAHGSLGLAAAGWLARLAGRLAGLPRPVPRRRP